MAVPGEVIGIGVCRGREGRYGTGVGRGFEFAEDCMGLRVSIYFYCFVWVGGGQESTDRGMDI